MKRFIQTICLFMLLLAEAFPSRSDDDSSVMSTITDVVVVVGNNRKAGSVIDAIGNIVNQSDADFSYSKPIAGKSVVSVDVQACTTSQPHVQEDFTITKRFASDSQSLVIFEWFPPSEATLLKNPMTNALKKAFEILKPGGELIIDNHPNFVFVEGFTSKKAQAMQSLNPFSLIINSALLVEIQSFIEGKVTSKADAFQKSLFIVTKILETKQEIIQERLKSLLIGFDQAVLLGALNDSTFYMFLWAYHSFSCSDAMASCLKTIGFYVNNSQIGIVPINPFNKRKWAWMISKIIKPIKENVDEKKSKEKEMNEKEE